MTGTTQLVRLVKLEERYFRAGAGGFLMLYAPHQEHERIKAALHDLRPIPIGSEPCGSRIIFYC